MAQHDGHESHPLSPYGPVAAELGLAAVRAVNTLAEIPEWRGEAGHRWLQSDHRAFVETIRYAFQAREAQTRLVIPADVRDPYDEMPLDWHIDTVHDALPFSEGERHYLIEYFYLTAGEGGPAEDAAGLVLAPPEYSATDPRFIMDAGQLRPLDATRVLDRWWSWRRAALGYAEHHTVDIACKALASVAAITTPQVPLAPAASSVAHMPERELRELRVRQRSRTPDLPD